MVKQTTLSRRSVLEKTPTVLGAAVVLSSRTADADSHRSYIELREETGYKDVDYKFVISGTDVERHYGTDNDDSVNEDYNHNMTFVRGSINGETEVYSFPGGEDILSIWAAGNVEYVPNDYYPRLEVTVDQPDAPINRIIEVRGEKHGPSDDNSEMSYQVRPSRSSSKYCCTEREDIIYSDETVSGRVDAGHKDVYELSGSYQEFLFEPYGGRIVFDEA